MAGILSENNVSDFIQLNTSKFAYGISEGIEQIQKLVRENEYDKRNSQTKHKSNYCLILALDRYEEFRLG